jgi:hypothetical protein
LLEFQVLNVELIKFFFPGALQQTLHIVVGVCLFTLSLTALDFQHFGVHNKLSQLLTVAIYAEFVITVWQLEKLFLGLLFVANQAGVLRHWADFLFNSLSYGLRLLPH